MQAIIAVLLAALPALGAGRVFQSAREIPVTHQVDVAVIGGSTGAVAAAVAAAGAGAKVFLAAPRTYLGEDMCATLRLWLEPGEDPAHPLARRIYSDWEGLEGQGVTRDPVRPMHVKKTLDDALLAANVPYLFSSYVTDVLVDAAGRPAGVVIANRAGRQAILAKAVIDATPRGAVARLAGARFRAYPKGRQVFLRYAVGGPVKSGEGVAGRQLKLAYRGDGTLKARAADAAPVHVVEYELRIDMPDGSFASFARAEQIARDLTFDAGQQTASDSLFQVPPDALRSARSARGPWRGADGLDLDAFRPAGIPNLWVLNGAADVPREQAARLLRPAALIEVGERIGKQAAGYCAAAPAPTDVRVAARKGEARAAGEVKEILTGQRGVDRDLARVPSPATTLPVLAEVDVAVVGGGTGGAPAGIAAARAGARTLVLEYLDGLGGVGTMGRITRYWWGYRGGFTDQIPGTGAKDRAKDNPRYEWNPLERSEWYRRNIRSAGGEVWYGVIGAGALAEGGTVKGVVVATPEGRGVVLARTVIDGTGNADVAAAAGAPTVTSGAQEIAVQGTGLPSINLGEGYTNTDFTITDETDVVDVWHTFVYAKNKYSSQFDVGQLIDSRERRRIVGDFEMSFLDQALKRTYPDTVAVAFSNFDTHGYTVDPYFLVDHPEKKGMWVDLPYRCFLPKGLDGILVIGLGISVHRDAVPLIRMQPDIQNHGYAMGLAAATAAKQGKSVRALDVRELQKRLVELDIVPRRVLEDKDSLPMDEEAVARAVKDLPADPHNAAALLAHPETASPLLRRAFAAASDEKEKFDYALMLAVLGDATGLDVLTAALDRQDWDAGWRYTGMGQFGGSMSLLDRIIVALGRTRDPRALDVILRKAEALTADSEFSHHRAVALALESIGDPRAAPVLAAILKKEGIAGHAIHDVRTAGRMSGLNVNETHTRGLSLRELSLARALYRCGDHEGLGRKILDEYARDLRGHVARHARAILDEAGAKLR